MVFARSAVHETGLQSTADIFPARCRDCVLPCIILIFSRHCMCAYQVVLTWLSSVTDARTLREKTMTAEGPHTPCRWWSPRGS